MLFSAFFTYAIPAPRQTCTSPQHTLPASEGTTHLARRDVPRDERDLRLARMARRGRGPDLPDGGLERLAGLDRGGEADAEEAQRGGVAAADRGDDRAGAEAEGGEAVQDHPAEAGCFANCRVCVRAHEHEYEGGR